MFNPLPPSDHEWRTWQSNSSCTRRLNKGNYCTPKFSLSFPNNFLTRFLLDQYCTRFDQLKTLPQYWWLKTRVWICTSTIGLLLPHIASMDHYRSPRLLIPSFKSCISNCSINCLDDWKSVVLVKKSNMANLQSNFKIFDQYQHFEVIFINWLRVDHNSSRKALKYLKGQNCQN